MAEPATPGPEQEGSTLPSPTLQHSNEHDATGNDASNSQTQPGQASGSSGSKSSSGAQMRSRITVVCAECKRLKLKCDRRMPCNSCLKRDTVQRCIYTQAAAEKIDVQSLHNRLLAVEGQVATLTSAQQAFNPAISDFKSSYPLATAQSASAGPSHAAQSGRPSNSILGGLPCNDRALLVTGTSGSSVVVSLEDTAGIWLRELNGGLGALNLSSSEGGSSSQSAAKTSSSTSSAPRIKLEPTPVVLPPSSSTRPSASPSAASTSSQTSSTSTNATGVVAPLPYSIFLPGSGVGTRSTASTPSGAPRSPLVPEYPALSTSKGELPQVTPALLRYLPTSAAIRAQFLEGLAATMELHPSFNFRHFKQRIEAMIAWGEANADASAKAKVDLARELFGTGPAVPKKPTPARERNTPKPTLSFFSAASAAFALGSLLTRDNGEPSSLNSADADAIHRNNPAALFALSEQSLALFEKTNSYDIDSVIAMLLQVLYLLHEGHMRVAHITFPLVGKMVNAARMIGLAIDPDEFAGTYTLFEAETRRRIWWDVVYYDAVVSDCLGQQPLIPDNSFNTRMPAEADESKFCPSSTAILPPEGEDITGRFSYFILKCKMVQLIKSIKQRTTKPATAEDTPDVTVEQAASHETEITKWLSELPTAYRLTMDIDISQPLPEEVLSNSTLYAQRCVLAIIANRQVLKLYLPFLRHTGAGGNTGNAAHQAVLGTINAAHAIVYACGLAHTIWADSHPSAFDYYDFGRSLFDAAVLCAQAIAQQPGNLLVVQGTKTVSSALDILRTIHANKSAGDASSIACEAVKIVEMMQQKADHARAATLADTATTGSKRKRSDAAASAPSSGLVGGSQLPFVGPSVSSVKSAQARPSISLAKIARRDSNENKSSKSSKGKEKAQNPPTFGIRVRDTQPPARPARPPTDCSTVSPTTPVAPAPPPPVPQSRMSEAPPSVSTPASDVSVGYVYPNPPPQPTRPPPIETLQHEFQMEYASSNNSAVSSSPQYAAPYPEPQSYPSNMYDSRQSPYTPVQAAPPSDAFRPGPTTQGSYMSPPYPPPTPTYQQNGSIEMAMGTYPQPLSSSMAYAGMTSSLPGTPRESRSFPLPAEKPHPQMYDHGMTKHEAPAEYQHTTATHGHALPHPTTSHIPHPYAAQGWQQVDMSRSGQMWDPKYYGHPPA